MQGKDHFGGPTTKTGHRPRSASSILDVSATLAALAALALLPILSACGDDSGTGQEDAAVEQDVSLQDAATPQDAATEHDAAQDATQNEDAAVTDGSVGDAGDLDGGEGNCPMSSLQMITVEPGTFTMGSPEDELGREDEVGQTGDEIQHQVTLTHRFEIGVYEITREQFVAFMGYNPSTMQLDCMDCPVDELRWSEAAAFTNAVSRCANLTPCYDCSKDEDGEWQCTFSGSSPYECEGYRLPTEAEWEYAARAGVQAAYTNGGNLVNQADEWDLDGNVPLDNGTLLDDICWFRGNSNYELHPVGTKPPNAWGLYNVIGNAEEWCHDFVAPYTADPVVDPWGPATGTDHITRGGNYQDSPAYHRLAYRLWYDDTLHIIGSTIRLVRTLP